MDHGLCVYRVSNVYLPVRLSTAPGGGVMPSANPIAVHSAEEHQRPTVDQFAVGVVVLRRFLLYDDALISEVMIDALTTVLVHPNAFYEQRDESPSLLYPAVIVGTLGLLGSISSVLVLFAFGGGLPEGAQPSFAVWAIVGLGAAFISPFISWLLYAIVFQVISYFFDGEGAFRETVVLSGWGFLPKIIGGLLSIGATFVVTQRVPSSDATGIRVIVPDGPQAMQQFSQQIQNDPVFQAVSVIGIALTLWSGYIWLFAVKHARNLSRNQALITVAILVLISIGITVGSLLLV